MKRTQNEASSCPVEGMCWERGTSWSLSRGFYSGARSQDYDMTYRHCSGVCQTGETQAQWQCVRLPPGGKLWYARKQSKYQDSQRLRTVQRGGEPRAQPLDAMTRARVAADTTTVRLRNADMSLRLPMSLHHSAGCAHDSHASGSAKPTVIRLT